MKKKKCLDIVRVEIDPMEITIHREQYKGLRMAEDIIRKHMNDGWIPVGERLPEDTWGVEVTRRDGERDIAWYFGEPEKVWMKEATDIPVDVIAWKEPSEPYRPERSEE